MAAHAQRQTTRIAVLLAVAGAAAVLPAACERDWNAREREQVRQALEEIQATAPAAPPADEAPEPVGPADDEEPAEVRLDLFDAIRLALANNQDVQIAGYEPLRAEADLVEARAVYDPAIVASNQFGRSKSPIASTLDTGAVTDAALTRDTWDFSGGLQQRLPTGGVFRITQEMGYLDSNSRFTVPNPQYTSGLALEVNQPLLKNFGDPEARAAIRVATLAAGVSLHEFRRRVMAVVSQVTTAYWQLAFDRRTVQILRRSHEAAREVLRRERVRAQRGVSNELNIARAASAAASRRVQLVRAENRARDAADRLKRLLAAPALPVQGRAEVVPVRRPRFFLVDVDRTASMARALANRPELVRARRLIEINRIRVDAADRQRLPRLDALLRYTLNGLGNDLGGSMDMQDFRDPVTWVGGLELEWPLGNRAARAEYRRRRVEYEQTLLEADRLTDEVLEEVSVAVRAVRRGQAEVESTLEARQAAQAVLAGEETRLELQPMDRRTNEELLRAQSQLAQTEQDHLLALLNFNLALTELGRARGTLLGEQGIDVVWPRDDRPGRLTPVTADLPEAARPVPDAAPAEAGPPAEAPPNAPGKPGG
ncbi:MAG: TolC family protein [Phycisphaerae bacterium]